MGDREERMTPVAIVPCPDYDEASVDMAIGKAIELLPEFSATLASAKRVLLKVNLTQVCPLDWAVTTHPAVVKATAKVLRGMGLAVDVGESSGGSGWPMWRRLRGLLFERLANSMVGKRFDEIEEFHERMMNIRSFHEALEEEIAGFKAPMIDVGELGIDGDIDFYRSCGILDAAASSGAELAYFDLEETRDLASSTARFLSEVPVCRSVCDAGRVVSMPKFKTHSFMKLTGAVKNFFGIVPTPRRGNLHETSLFADMLAEMLVDVFSVVLPPPLVVCDAVMGMEGCGPLEGPPRFMGLILAGCDCVAHDAVMAALMGMDPMEVPTTRLAYESGLGEGRPDHIEIRGLPLELAGKPDWDRSNDNKSPTGWAHR